MILIAVLKCVELPVGPTLKIDMSNQNSDPSLYAYVHSALSTINFLTDVEREFPILRSYSGKMPIKLLIDS
jgi:hypothetical protein